MITDNDPHFRGVHAEVSNVDSRRDGCQPLWHPPSTRWSKKRVISRFNGVQRRSKLSVRWPAQPVTLFEAAGGRVPSLSIERRARQNGDHAAGLGFYNDEVRISPVYEFERLVQGARSYKLDQGLRSFGIKNLTGRAELPQLRFADTRPARTERRLSFC